MDYKWFRKNYLPLISKATDEWPIKPVIKSCKNEQVIRMYQGLQFVYDNSGCKVPTSMYTQRLEFCNF